MRPSSNLKLLAADSDVAQDDNWMLSYIDVFVLITTLFLMLLVINQAHFGTSDRESPATAHHTALPSDSLTEPAKPYITESLAAQDLKARPPEADLPTKTETSALFRALDASIREHGLEDHVQLLQEQDKTRLEIQSRVLFDSGDAYLTRSGEALLDRVRPMLRDTQGVIVIEGHTDNQPIKTRQYPSNWSLAAARATEVLEFFIAEGFDENRFRAVSFGDTQPIAANNNESNRRKNRRVSLVLEH